MVIVLFHMIIPVMNSIDSNIVQCEEWRMDEGWNLNVDGKVLTNQTLSKLHIDCCDKGDVVILQRRIEEECDVSNPVLRLYSVHSVVEIFLDNELIYEFGKKDYEAGKMIGYGLMLVDLPDNYAGKDLRVRFTITEDESVEGFQYLSVVEGTKYLRHELNGKKIDLLICMFLILFGIITMGLSIFMMNKNNSFMQTFCIAMFSFLMGCWSFCNNDIVSFLVEDNGVKVQVEYLSIYFISIPFTYYFRHRIEEEGMPFWLVAIFWILLGSEIAFVGAAVICQYINLAHYPQFLKYCHIIMVFALFFLAALNIEEIKQKRFGRNAVTKGFGIAIVVVIIELVKYNLGKYVTGFSENEYNSSASLATLIIVISMLVDYAQGISNDLYKDAQQKLLLRMAYVDELTGLANRRYCEDKLEEYNESHTHYAVMSLDMNFLKKVNDSLGHEYGDALLKRFGNMLQEVYGERGTVGRMGGDEFIVILPEVTVQQVEELIEEMNKTMRIKNVENPKLKLSTAWGYAMSTEAYDELDSHVAYRIADARMYENKRESKLGRM